jgi:hypothetical protein
MIKSERLIQKYCEEFYGYGSWDSETWFIGMEEGGRDSAKESAIEKRLELWQSRGSRDVESAPDFYKSLNYADEWFHKKPKRQATWHQLIRLQLHLDQIEVTDEDIFKVQTTSWGKNDSKSAIFELFALPVPNSREWPYPNFCEAWFLKNRGIYTHFFYNQRAATLRQKIWDHCPKRVIFYGITYKFLYEGLIQKTFENTPVNGVQKVSVGKTHFFLIRHPAAQTGVNNAYFQNAGSMVSKFIN